MIVSLLVCLAAFLLLLLLLRRDQVSLGLPVAYLSSLLLIHVPGALAHVLAPTLRLGSEWTRIGIGYAATGAACFVAGVWLARWSIPEFSPHKTADRRRFRLFCLMGGWLFVYALSPLHSIPSVGALVDEGGAIWMLGVLLGLRAASKQKDRLSAGVWVGTLMVYPALMLLLGGFVSYGSAAIIIVTSALTVSTRRYAQALGGVALAGFLGLSLFVTYFQHREAIRDEVWGGAPLADRVNSVTDMLGDFEFFDPSQQKQENALDARLNQNIFVGLAQQRINSQQVDYLYGQSIWDALLALVPRALWAEKPVTAGSPQIVSEMTGLKLSPTTSFGVGNVMELQINFGLPGIVFGFLAFGWLLGTLDRRAAAAENRGELGKCILFVLPSIALVQPNGSLVELASGSAASMIAAISWKWLWERWVNRGVRGMRGTAGHRDMAYSSLPTGTHDQSKRSQ
jgi:hypothetical protein